MEIIAYSYTYVGNVSTDADDVITFAINFILNYELHFQLIGRADVDQITSFIINPPLNANYGSN